MHRHVRFFSLAGSGVALARQVDLVLSCNFCRHLPVFDHNCFVRYHSIHAVLVINVQLQKRRPFTLLSKNWGSLHLLSWRFYRVLKPQDFLWFLSRHRFWGSIEAPLCICRRSRIHRGGRLTLHFLIDALRDGL